MAKTYLDIVKYMVEAKFSISGSVDKPDIIGAVFGQTEGLLGDELDLRELQKNGKIGRIEIDINRIGNKCVGKLLLPASLDRVETCILAAAIESVDRVGPYESQFQIEKVEDIRTEKRGKILSRAKELVKKLMSTGVPDSRELAELVQSEVRSSEISSYGPDNVPAGPDIDKSNDVIIVEGRADVLNLLRFGIANTIAVGGATNNISKTIIKLCREKETTIFADGDRGGDLIIRSLLNVADVDYVTKAPEGTEVEELTRKEVIKALRSKIPIEQYTGLNKSLHTRQYEDNSSSVQQKPPQIQESKQFETKQPQENKQYNDNKQFRDSKQYSDNKYKDNQSNNQKQHVQSQGVSDDEDAIPINIKSIDSDQDEDEDSFIPKIQYERQESKSIHDKLFESNNEEQSASQISHIPQSKPKPEVNAAVKPALDTYVLSQLGKSLTELSDTLRSRLVANDGSVIKEIPIRELISTIQDTDNVYGIVLDGIITQRLIELAMQKNIKAIYGIRANPIPKKHSELILYTKEQGKID
jgi:DNA primase